MECKLKWDAAADQSATVLLQSDYYIHVQIPLLTSLAVDGCIKMIVYALVSLLIICYIRLCSVTFERKLIHVF